MINLLPNEEKEQLKKEAAYKKVLLILFFLIMNASLLDGSLFVLTHRLKHKIEEARTAVAQKEEQFKETNFADFKKVVSRLNQHLSVVKASWQEQTSPSLFFKELAQLAPSGLYFTTFIFEGPPSFEVNIAGRAAGRGDLFIFKKALEEGGSFEDVYFLPSSWVKAKEPDFSLRFVLKH